MILKTTLLTEKKNPDDFQGLLLLQLLLILRNKFFLSVWFLQKQQVAPVANLGFLRIFWGLGVPQCKDEQPLKSMEL